jgi:hypothetical protein
MNNDIVMMLVIAGSFIVSGLMVVLSDLGQEG